MKIEKLANESITAKLKKLGITDATKIQEMSIPEIAKGHDIIIKSETGSGKTFAFLIPIIEKLEHKNQVLVLAPTRELAKQIFGEFKKISDKYAAIVYGGVSMDKQIKQLEKSYIVIGTPGRILDMINRGYLDLSKTSIFILDEFDKMLEMGFKDDVKRIESYIGPHQKIYASATLKHEVLKEIGKDVVRIETKTKTIPKSLKQYYVDAGARGKLKKMVDFIKGKKEKILIFCATKSATRYITDRLKRIRMNADYINGDLPQKKREKILDDFTRGKIQIMVATDVASRGIHVNDIGIVINYDCPNDVETYVHRIGRTARQGREGTAVTFIETKDYRNFQNIVNKFSDIEKIDL